MRKNSNQSVRASFLNWNGNKQLMFLLEGKEISKGKSIFLLLLVLFPVLNAMDEIPSTSSDDTHLPRISTQISASYIFFHIQWLLSLSALHLFCLVQIQHVHVFQKWYSTICGWAVTFECIPVTVDETHFSLVCLFLLFRVSALNLPSQGVIKKRDIHLHPVLTNSPKGYHDVNDRPGSQWG